MVFKVAWKISLKQLIDLILEKKEEKRYIERFKSEKDLNSNY